MDGDLSLENLRRCQAELEEFIVRTPVLAWRPSAATNPLPQQSDVRLKLELFQKTGTFKARGALNSIRCLDPDARARGVTAISAGNHAVAVAFAARELRVSAKVVMYRTANPTRIDRARFYGAEIVFADPGPGAFHLAEEIASREGRTLVHPFEGPSVAQGTGTLGLEFGEQVEGLDAVVIAIGGGGLCAGASAAIKQLQPGCKIYGVEPEGADAMRRSFAAGEPVVLDRVSTIADSLAPPMVLPYSFGVCRRFVEEIVTVSDDEIRSAMQLLFNDLKLAVEPAGAAATAAVAGPLCSTLRGQRIGVVVCGSIIDPQSFVSHLGSARAVA